MTEEDPTRSDFEIQSPQGRAVPLTGVLSKLKDIERSGEDDPASGLRSGTKLGKYVLQKQIGYGGMGTVFLADVREKKGESPVAIKVLRDNIFPDSSVIKRFQVEAQTVSELNHPGIVPVYEVGKTGRFNWFAMEFVEGQTLKQWLLVNRPSYREKLEAFEKIALIVHHAHERGVIHRDLKPSNIMLDKDNMPRVLDFGLAKMGWQQQGESFASLSITGDILGTPDYMAPEQAEGRVKDIDARTDVYCLGVMLYEAMTGEKPFRADNVVALLHTISKKAPTPPSELAIDIDINLENVILKALAKDPHNRYLSAEALSQDIERCIHGRPVTARPIFVLPTWYKTALLVLLGSALCGYGTYWLLHQDLITELENERKARIRAEKLLEALPKEVAR